MKRSSTGVVIGSVLGMIFSQGIFADEVTDRPPPTQGAIFDRNKDLDTRESMLEISSGLQLRGRNNNDPQNKFPEKEFQPHRYILEFKYNGILERYGKPGNFMRYFQVEVQAAPSLDSALDLKKVPFQFTVKPVSWLAESPETVVKNVNFIEQQTASLYFSRDIELNSQHISMNMYGIEVGDSRSAKFQNYRAEAELVAGYIHENITTGESRLKFLGVKFSFAEVIFNDLQVSDSWALNMPGLLQGHFELLGSDFIQMEGRTEIGFKYRPKYHPSIGAFTFFLRGDVKYSRAQPEGSDVRELTVLEAQSGIRWEK